MSKFLSITMMISQHILVSLLTIVPLTTLAFPAQLISLRCETTNFFLRNYSTSKNMSVGNHSFTSNNYYPPINYSIRNSSDEPNLNLLISSLTQITPISGFAASIVGEPPHQVYGLAQCLSGISNESCTSCLAKGSQHLLGSCPYDDGGIAYLDKCAIRYSADNFFFQLSTIEQQIAQCTAPGPLKFILNGTATGPFIQDQSTKKVLSMIKSISKIAAYNKTVRMFATGVDTRGNEGSRVYGMAQCTRDLSEHQCYKCLRQSFNRLCVLCDCSQSEGAAGSLSCLVKYARFKFFDSDPTWVPPLDQDSGEL